MRVLPALVLVIAGLAPTATAAPERMAIELRSWGCMRQDSVQKIVLRRLPGGDWRAGRHNVPNSLVEALRATLMDEVTFKDFESSFEIDPVVVEEHSSMIAGELVTVHGLAADEAAELAPEIAAQLLRCELTMHLGAECGSDGPCSGLTTISTSAVRLSAVLPGTPPLEFYTATHGPLFMPWHVKLSDGRWVETWSMDSVAAMGDLMAAAGKPLSLLDISQALRSAPTFPDDWQRDVARCMQRRAKVAHDSDR